jgi:hypothetical protein
MPETINNQYNIATELPTPLPLPLYNGPKRVYFSTRYVHFTSTTNLDEEVGGAPAHINQDVLNSCDRGGCVSLTFQSCCHEAEWTRTRNDVETTLLHKEQAERSRLGQGVLSTIEETEKSTQGVHSTTV